jgi:A/G-specific adenine glycosylase
MPRPSSTKQNAVREASPLTQGRAQSGSNTGGNALATPLSIAALLIEWQKKAGRHDLPWQVRDPYRVWLSEIMLQQTQVSTVIPYYLNFLNRFPNLSSLALANEESVLEAWSGLGYYSRARNLHRCAKRLVQEYQGEFPSSLELLETLPGIGRSTAAAIAVFCFSKREAILDGNVKRVLSRLFAIAGNPSQSSTEKELWAIALQQLPMQDIESYTQGLMDLGASLCAPRKLRCSECPLQHRCIAHRLKVESSLPTPKPRKTIPLREETFALIMFKGKVLLERQKSPGIWGGLLSFPKQSAMPGLAKALGCTLPKPISITGFDHSFTHFKLQAKINLYHFSAESPRASQMALLREPGAQYEAGQTEYRLLEMVQVAAAALPQPIKSYLLTQPLKGLA